MSRELSQVCRAQTRGEVAGKTRQEEMDVEEKRNVNIFVHYYTIIHIFPFF